MLLEEFFLMPGCGLTPLAVDNGFSVCGDFCYLGGVRGEDFSAVGVFGNVCFTVEALTAVIARGHFVGVSHCCFLSPRMPGRSGSILIVMFLGVDVVSTNVIDD